MFSSSESIDEGTVKSPKTAPPVQSATDTVAIVDTTSRTGAVQEKAKNPVPPPARRRVISVSSDLHVSITDGAPASAAVAAIAVSPPKAAKKKRSCKFMLPFINNREQKLTANLFSVIL